MEKKKERIRWIRKWRSVLRDTLDDCFGRAPISPALWATGRICGIPCTFASKAVAIPPLVTEPLAFHDCSSYFSTFPWPPSLGGVSFFSLFLSLSPLCISCNRNSRRFQENYLQIIFIGGLCSFFRKNFFLFFSSIIWCFFDVSNIRYIYVYTGSWRILKVRWFGGITDRSVAWISNFCNFVPRMD